MKRLLGTVLALLLLTACGAADTAALPAGPTPVPTPAASPAADTVTVTDLPPGEMLPLEGPALDYDEIRSIELWGTEPAELIGDYFTVCRDGLWGLMRADGTELLPCLAGMPVTCCGLHWHWDAPIGWDEMDAYTAALRATNDGELEGGHDGGGRQFFYDVDRAALRVLPAALGTIRDVDAAETAHFGTLLPVCPRHAVTGTGNPDLLGDPVGDWFFIDAGSGEQVHVTAQQAVTAAGWFYDEALAPVQLDGEDWAYVDRSGALVTGAVYAPVYAETCRWDDALGDYVYTVPCLASPLQNGYAAVRRADTGGWGLLDAAGAETVPAVYAGCAWDGTVLWLRLDSQSPWQAYTPAA